MTSKNKKRHTKYVMYTKMFQKKYFSIEFLKIKIKNTIFEFTIHR